MRHADKNNRREDLDKRFADKASLDREGTLPWPRSTGKKSGILPAPYLSLERVEEAA